MVILVCFSLPLAWWLARKKSGLRAVVWSITALPLVLPPSVLGFYILIGFAPDSLLGGLARDVFDLRVVFSFTGLVIASCIYSLPFVIQPLQVAFEQVDRRTIDAAYSLGASKLKTLWRVVMPQIRGGLIVALTLGFAHTVGEFGVVLMVGGNIPGETQVLSIAIYESVETLNYAYAHQLSLGLIVFSILVLIPTYYFNRSYVTAGKVPYV